MNHHIIRGMAAFIIEAISIFEFPWFGFTCFAIFKIAINGSIFDLVTTWNYLVNHQNISYNINKYDRNLKAGNCN
jgi:hypothetical protein